MFMLRFASITVTWATRWWFRTICHGTRCTGKCGGLLGDKSWVKAWLACWCTYHQNITMQPLITLEEKGKWDFVFFYLCVHHTSGTWRLPLYCGTYKRCNPRSSLRRLSIDVSYARATSYGPSQMSRQDVAEGCCSSSAGAEGFYYVRLQCVRFDFQFRPLRVILSSSLFCFVLYSWW